MRCLTSLTYTAGQGHNINGCGPYLLILGQKHRAVKEPLVFQWWQLQDYLTRKLLYARHLDRQSSLHCPLLQLLTVFCLLIVQIAHASKWLHRLRRHSVEVKMDNSLTNVVTFPSLGSYLLHHSVVCPNTHIIFGYYIWMHLLIYC